MAKNRRAPYHLPFAPANVFPPVLVVLNLVGGFQALGTLLAVGLMMLPATAAPPICSAWGSERRWHQQRSK